MKSSSASTKGYYEGKLPAELKEDSGSLSFPGLVDSGFRPDLATETRSQNRCKASQVVHHRPPILIASSFTPLSPTVRQRWQVDTCVGRSPRPNGNRLASSLNVISDSCSRLKVIQNSAKTCKSVRIKIVDFVEASVRSL